MKKIISKQANMRDDGRSTPATTANHDNTAHYEQLLETAAGTHSTH
jgi:hypothetical protein